MGETLQYPTRRLALGWLWAAALLPLLLVGCQKDGAERYRLSGKITWNGRPIPAGILYFDPDLASGQDGPQGHATITNGEYDTAKEGLGPGSGKYAFRLYAFNGIPGNEAPMGGTSVSRIHLGGDIAGQRQRKEHRRARGCENEPVIPSRVKN